MHLCLCLSTDVHPWCPSCLCRPQCYNIKQLSIHSGEDATFQWTEHCNISDYLGANFIINEKKQRQQMGERRDTVMAAAPPWTAREADCGDWWTVTKSSKSIDNACEISPDFRILLNSVNEMPRQLYISFIVKKVIFYPHSCL